VNRYSLLAKNDRIASLLLRIGLAAVLLYASVSSFITPSDWIGYLPHAATSIVPATVLLPVFSVYETLVALWLLSGLRRRAAAVLAALTFLGIILSNVALFAITFRDIPMVFAAVALWYIEGRDSVAIY